MAIAMSLELSTTLVNKRTASRIVREANTKVGEYVGKRILPMKFNRYAYTAYRGTFIRRNPEYAKEKWKKVGHNIPNVLTGKLKAHVLTPGLGYRVTSTQHRGRVQINAPFPMKRPQRDELEVVNDRDQKNMADVAIRYFTRQIGMKKNQKKRVIKRRGRRGRS